MGLTFASLLTDHHRQFGSSVRPFLTTLMAACSCRLAAWPKGPFHIACDDPRGDAPVFRPGNGFRPLRSNGVADHLPSLSSQACGSLIYLGQCILEPCLVARPGRCVLVLLGVPIAI